MPTYINSTQESDPGKDLDFGARFPFDAPDSWFEDGYSHLPPPEAQDWAVFAARGVIENLRDRRSIKQGFNDIAEDVRLEIVTSLAAIIRRAQEFDTTAAS